MTNYNKNFAKLYSMELADYPANVAGKILNYFESVHTSCDRTLLDLCCGTGNLARFFLERGYDVTGIDASADMLEHALNLCRDFVDKGRARFICADVRHFICDRKFALITSTSDSINHLKDYGEMEKCFSLTFNSLAEGGLFIFDMITKLGLERWNSISVSDADEMTVIKRGVSGTLGNLAYNKITAFMKTEGGLYEKAEILLEYFIFGMERVRQILENTGFKSVKFVKIKDFSIEITNPEEQRRIFIIARK